MQATFYKPSGKVSPTFFLYLLLVMIVSIPILSAAYIYLIHYIPIIYVNFIITGGVGAAFGFLVGFCAKHGKARNTAIVMICTFIGMVVMKYVQWAIYIPLIFTDIYGILNYSIAERFLESFYLLTYPTFMLDAAEFINEFGVWGIGFNPANAVTGIPLLIVWIGEFLLMTIVALVVAGIQTDIPFSEETGKWYTTSKEALQFDVPENLQALRSDMENGNFQSLTEQLELGQANELEFLSLTFAKPPEESLSEPFFVTLTKSVTTPVEGKSKKEPKTKTDTLLKHLAVGQQTAKEMMAIVPVIPEPVVEPVSE